MHHSSRSLKLASLPFLLVFLPAVSFAQSQQLFFEPPPYTSCFGGDGAQVVADFNQDGKLDLACADGTVLLGNGDGTFRTGTPLSVGGFFIAAADFNSDGKLDLLLTGNYAALYVLLGKGDGTFQPAVGTATGTAMENPVVADVNGDGKLDVLGLSNNPAFLFEFLGHGDGTFASAVQIPVGSVNPFGPMISADFNGDGKADVAISGSANGGNAVGVLLGNGDGTFQPPVVTSLPQPPTNMAKGDFNNDGKLDLVVGSFSGGGTSLCLGNGDGSFQPPLLVAPFGGNLGVADFNGDGSLDLAIAASFEVIFLGNGNGTFTSTESYLGGGLSTVGDFNGDGKPDLATGNNVLLGSGNGVFQGNPAVIAGGYVLTAGVTGDFNGDGIADIAVTNGAGLNGGTAVSLLLSEGTGKFLLGNSYGLSLPTYAIATSDLNGDGKLDLVVIAADFNSWSLNVLLGNGDGSFGSPIVFLQAVPNNDLGQIVIADFNGDHKPDVAVLSNSELAIFLGNGDGTFASPVSYFAGSDPSRLAAADFNNDGNVDVAVASAVGLAILLGKGDGTFQPATFSSQLTGLSAVADLNLDGNADLIDSTQVLLGKGDGTFGNPIPTGGQFGSLALADVNGDGLLDLVTAYPNTNLHPLQVSLGHGDGTFASPISVISLNGETQFLLAADFNGDGKPDLAVPMSAGVVTLLNITQPGPTLSASTLSPATVAAGASATSTITIRPANGFNATVALSCSSITLNGAPATTAPPACSFSPASIPNSLGRSILTISTTAASATLTPPAMHPSGLLYALWLPIGGMALIGAGVSSRAHGKWLLILVFCVMLSGLIFLAACGGGNGGSGGGGGTPGGGGGGGSAGTPAGAYTITIKAAAGSIVNTTNVTLTVQ
jgi:hypothetical protein